MSTPKKKISRKPSVLVSRQFKCAHAFGGDQSVKTATHSVASGITAERRNGEESKLKIIWNGRDATPIPLVYQDHDDSSPSLDEVSNLFESMDFENGEDLNAFDQAGVTWIPTVMNELCLKCKETTPA